jgi:hypothetical protein
MNKREPRTDELGIIKYDVKITWSDGRTENLSPDLPEYLAKEIEQYLDELEDLRNEQGDDEYNFSEE